jgi:2-succinyl-5-enolpyruvyl-6-hydroxy-3-cyclohexene-1-carboxylate synthase
MYAPTVELALPCPVSDLPNLEEVLSEGFPLHLHVRLDDSAEPPCSDFSRVEVGDAPPAPRFRGSLVDVSQMLRFRSMEGLVLLIGALNPDEQEPVLWLAQTLRVPVLAEASSGLREELAPYLLHGGDEMLKCNAVVWYCTERSAVLAQQRVVVDTFFLFYIHFFLVVFKRFLN